MKADEQDPAFPPWIDTATPFPAESTVPELFEAQAARHGDKPALVMQGRALTYAELDARANALACRLRRSGVKAGSIVGITLDRSFDMVAGLLAILKAGGAYLPFDYEFPGERIGTMLADAGATVLVTDAAARRRLAVDVDAIVHADAPGEPDSDAGGPVAPGAGPDDLAYVNYTSGSSGAPKGVMIPHRAVASLLFEANYARLDEDCRVLQLAPASFDALTFELWGPLLHGGCCVLFNGRFPTVSRLRQTIHDNGVTTVFLTTALFNTVIDEAPDVLRPVRELLTGGETHSIRHIRRALEQLPDTAISSVYGPTEATTFATHFPLARLSPDAKSVPLGTATNNRQVFVLDAERRICPAGVAGEIHVAGPGLAAGYLGKPELTAERFVTGLPFLPPGERAYRTGDLGRCTADGTIEFLGRADNQVKIHGFRVELGEIEQTLLAHDRVRRAFVTVEEKAGEKRLVAAVVAPRAVLDELPDLLRSKLPAFMLPRRYLAFDEFPLNTNGKIDRERILSRCAEEPAR